MISSLFSIKPVATLLCTAILVMSSGAIAAQPTGKYFRLSHRLDSEADLPELSADAMSRGRASGFDTIFASVETKGMDWFFGSTYSYTRYIYHDVNSRNRDLHKLRFPIFLKGDSKNLSWSFNLAPGIATSSNALKDPFNRTNDQDFNTNAGFLSSLLVSSHWRFLSGLNYDHKFGGFKLYPVLGVETEGLDKLTLRLAYPDSLLNFKPSDQWEVFAALYPMGDRWHVHSDDFQQEFYYTAEGWRAELGLTWHIRPALAISVSGGYQFDRKFDFADDAGLPLESSIDNALTFAIDLEFTLSDTKKH